MNQPSHLLRTFAISFFFYAAAFAQQITLVPGNSPDGALAEFVKADLELRATLAERLVAAKESPGREFPAAFRRSLIEGLKRETMEQLEARLGTGNIASQALGDTKSDMVYSTFQQPCRIADTRVGGGIIASSQTRDFEVVGNDLAYQGGSATGCGVPSGATAVMINLVAVNPVAAGNLRGSAYPQAIPATGSLLNYQVLASPLNVANGLILPICDPTTADCQYDMRIYANGGATHLVADVLGYWMRFPKETLQNRIVQAHRNTTTAISPVCTNYTGLSLPFTAPANGKIRVRGTVQLLLYFNPPPEFPWDSIFYVYLATSPTTCSGVATRDRSQVETPDLIRGVGTAVNLPLDAVYQVTANTTTTFTINGTVVPFNPSTTGQFFYATLVAEFTPD